MQLFNSTGIDLEHFICFTEFNVLGFINYTLSSTLDKLSSRFTFFLLKRSSQHLPHNFPSYLFPSVAPSLQAKNCISPGLHRTIKLSVSKHYMALAFKFDRSQTDYFFSCGFSFDGDRLTFVSNLSRSMWYRGVGLRGGSIPGLKAGLYIHTNRSVSLSATVIVCDIKLRLIQTGLIHC
jgi:hypothetical protein